MVQLAEPATDVPQVFVCTKSPEFVPLVNMLVIGTGAAPRFVTVMVFPVLVFPTLVDGNDSVLGVKVIAFPVPLRVTTWGDVGSGSVMESVALRAPASFGVKFRVIVQLVPPAIVPPQLLV